MPAVCPQCDNRQSANKKTLLQRMKSSGACYPRYSIHNRRFINEAAFNTEGVFHTAVDHLPNYDCPTYDCTVCVRTPHTPPTLEFHYCGPPAHTKCDRCGRGFKDAPACEEHHRTSHPKTPCICCGGMTFYEDALDQHHWVPGNHPCSLCDVEFKDDTTYAEHVSATHAKLQRGPCWSHIETGNPVQAHFTLPPVHPVCNKCGQRFKFDDVRNAHTEDSPISPLSLATDFDTTKKDYHIIIDEQYDDPGSTSTSGANASGNMFSSDSCFTGGAYYHVRGDAHFSPPPSQISPGLKILHENISASACHDSRERFPPPRCHPLTRKEILDTIITQTSSSFKVFYLFGSEGTGKSAIAQTIAEHYKSNGTLDACFFFSRERHERNTDQKLIATLAYQLCVNIPGLKPFIVKAVEDDLSTFHKDMDTQIERLIMNPMVQASDEGIIRDSYPILIVVDGIDECEGMKEQRAFLKAISRAVGRHNLPLYFVITSRPETHIVDWLNQDPIVCSTSHRLDLDLDTHTKRDIEVYVRSEFERIRKVHHIPESFVWPCQASIQALVSETNMLFRCASEIMAFIDDQNDTPQNRLEDILRTSTQSSSGSYS